MNCFFKEMILKMGQIQYVRASIDGKADLSAFREAPTLTVLLGVFAIGMSFVIGWPAVAALGFLAVQFDNPWIVVVGGPFTYGMSHLLFLLGMYLSGAKYSLIFLRWLTRVTTERLLIWADR